MFTVDPNIQDLQVKERVIARLLFSMNSPQIATPELSTEEARCYIMLFRTGNVYSAYIGLYLPGTDRRFFYSYSANPVPENGLAEVMDISNRFAEEMGFLLDELKLSGMSVDERNQWIEDQPFFGYKKKEEAAKAAPAAKEPAQPAETSADAPEKPSETPPPPERPAAVVESRPPLTPPPPEHLSAAASASASMGFMELDPIVEPSAPEQPAPAAPKRAPVRQKAEKMPLPPADETAGENVDEEPGQVQDLSRAAAAKTQKPRQKKAPQSTTGTVSREYEALARLLASF